LLAFNKLHILKAKLIKRHKCIVNSCI